MKHKISGDCNFYPLLKPITWQKDKEKAMCINTQQHQNSLPLKLACAQGWEDGLLLPGPSGHFTIVLLYTALTLSRHSKQQRAQSHFIVSHLQINHGGMQGSVQEAFSQSKLKSVLLTYFSRYLCRIIPREKNYVLDIIIEACTPQLPNSAYL